MQIRLSNWKEVELGDEKCFEIVMGQSPPGDSYNETKEGIPFFQGKAEFTDRFPVIKKWTTKPSKLAEPNSILMSVRAPVGDVNLCNIRCCIGRGLASIRPLEGVDLVYVYHFLSTNREKISSLGSGSTFKAITSKQLSQIKIPLPSLETQKKIVSILEKAEALKQKRELADKLTQEYLKSVFAEMFLKEKNNEIKLEECCEDIFAGGDVPQNNLSWEKTEKYDIPIFTNGEKNRGLYGYTSISKVYKPSITISARGTIGYPEVRNEKFYPAIRLIVLVPNKKIINLYFLKYALNKFDFSSIQGTSIPQLTVPMIKPLKIPLPPIELQNKFASIVEHVEKMKEKQLKNKDYIGELFNSLMQKAFNGELVS